MAKTAVTFLRGWSRYNSGDIAAFEADQAKALIDAGIAIKAPPKDPKKTVIGTLAVDVRDSPAFREVQDEIRSTVARIAGQEAALEARAASLEARAAELARREAALDAREDELLALAKAMDAASDQADAGQDADAPDADAPDADDDTPAPASDAGKPAKGGLPKQGR